MRLVELIRDGRREVVNMFPRCVTREGNLAAQQQLWSVFAPTGGRWRGIAHVPNGNLRLRDEWAHVDARRRFAIDLHALWDDAPSRLAQQCICGDIMSGICKSPRDCRLFGGECVPEHPVGACMVEQRRHVPDLAPVRRRTGPRRMPGGGVMTVTATSTARVAMKHGAGGRAMRAAHRAGVPARLPRSVGVGVRRWTTARAIPIGGGWLVVTTDSHVIQPIFFPGGDIGRLAVAGTVNDLAMMGATEPLGLTCGVILEEGFPIEDSRAIQASMRAACERSGRRRSSPATPR